MKPRSWTAAAVLALSLSVAPVSPGARAAVSVSDLTVSGTGPFSFHYLLNEAASSGRIEVVSAAAPDTPVATVPLGSLDLARGAHDVSFTPSGLAAGSYRFRVAVAADAHTGYDVIVPVTALPSGASVRYGVRINSVAGALAQGHMFLADTGTPHAIHEYRADGTYAGAIAPKPTYEFAYIGLDIGADGNVYASQQDEDKIEEYAASGSATSATWALVKAYTGPASTAVVGDGTLTTRSIRLFGAGDTARAYLTDYLNNQVTVTTLGQTSTAPSPLFGGANLAGGRIDQVLVSPDEQAIYVGSGSTPGTGRHLNRWLYGVPLVGSAPAWYLDPDFLQNDTAKQTMTGASKGLAFSPDGRYLYVTQAKSADVLSNYVAKLTVRAEAPGPSVAARILGAAAGLTLGDASLDLDGDGSVDVADAVAALRNTVPAGTVVGKIAMPAGVALPVTLDVDAHGNLLVAANLAGTSVTGADAFFVLAPPDNGSTDTQNGPPFTVN